METIGIIGAGVSGLTTAIQLQDAGYSVVIHAAELPMQTTSAKAAAIWMPFIAEPVEQVNAWSQYSFDVFEALYEEETSGISPIELLALSPVETPPDWSRAMPAQQFRRARREELPTGYLYGFIAEVPLIETPIYLAYLWNRFRSNGGQLIKERIQEVTVLADQYALVINCSGLGAKQLFNDAELYPVQGHLVKVKKEANIRCLADDDGPNALAYIIPRSDCIVLGGTSDIGQYSLEAKSEKVEGILERCQQLDPAIKGLHVIQTEVGLRPARTRIRCELDQERNIIHNYGHGGSGYTVSWGCAADVLHLAHLFLEKS